MIKIISTKTCVSGIKLLVYGPSGIGKTVLCSTAPKPLILSAESGLLSLSRFDLPVIEISSIETLSEVYSWLNSSTESLDYSTICLDSITEIAEVVLSQYKKLEKDPRQAYGKLIDTMSTFIRKFRDLPHHVYFSAVQLKSTDDSGVTSFCPSMPGKALVNNLPYFFDLVLPLRLGKLSNGQMYRYLQTHSDFQYEGKDRSGKLDKIEEPNLSKLFSKILTNQLKEENENGKIDETR